METYDEIELTEEERIEALRAGREKKFFDLKRRKHLEDVRQTTHPRAYTAEEWYMAFVGMFPIDDRREKDYSLIVKMLCCYFSGDRRFNNPKKELSLNKGLLLFGGVGVGKTTLMDAFKRNQVFSYRVISCREVESEFSINGPGTVDRFSVNCPIAVNSNPFGHTEIGYCFDDIGTENATTKHFGNSKNVMTDILLNRYDSKLDYRSTHLTTNLSVEEIESLYGTRVLDRIREMFNIIAFPKEFQSRR